ncbi:MAG: hypothetical protein HC828_05100 [Blastochloris sp.]|nr:hypothetical protein [Blastochloris sp.]
MVYSDPTGKYFEDGTSGVQCVPPQRWDIGLQGCVFDIGGTNTSEASSPVTESLTDWWNQDRPCIDYVEVEVVDGNGHTRCHQRVTPLTVLEPELSPSNASRYTSLRPILGSLGNILFCEEEESEGGNGRASASGNPPNPDFPIPPSQDDVARARRQLGLPPRATSMSNESNVVAVLLADGREFWGVNGAKPISFRVNNISKTHAEIDALDQLVQMRQETGIRGGRAVMTVDQPPCAACGRNGGIRSGVEAAGLDELKVLYPGGETIIRPRR